MAEDLSQLATKRDTVLQFIGDYKQVKADYARLQAKLEVESREKEELQEKLSLLSLRAASLSGGETQPSNAYRSPPSVPPTAGVGRVGYTSRRSDEFGSLSNQIDSMMRSVRSPYTANREADEQATSAADDPSVSDVMWTSDIDKARIKMQAMLVYEQQRAAVKGGTAVSQLSSTPKQSAPRYGFQSPTLPKWVPTLKPSWQPPVEAPAAAAMPRSLAPSVHVSRRGSANITSAPQLRPTPTPTPTATNSRALSAAQARLDALQQSMRSFADKEARDSPRSSATAVPLSRTPRAAPRSAVSVNRHGSVSIRRQ